MQRSDPAPFSVTEPAGEALPVVVHVPHAGTWIPEQERAAYALDDAQLAEELRLMTDHRTEHLAAGATELGATVVVNHLSRLVVDPERFVDGDEMDAVGMGFAYERTAHGGSLREVDGDAVERLRRDWFDPYTQAVADVVRRVADRHGRCVVLDVHSYPEHRLPYELHGDGPRPEVCLGTDPFHTPTWLVEGIEELCTDLGLEAARDTPFAGVYIPTWSFRRDSRVEGVMLEVRRDTYLEESTLRPHEGEDRVRRLVENVVRLAGAGVTPGA